MAKSLWKFTGLTYDNVLITVEEEIDMYLSRSDAERLCMSRNGLKKILTSSPISRPLRNNTAKDSYGNREGGGELIELIFWVFMISIAINTLIVYFIPICSAIGFYEGLSFGRNHLKKEETFSYTKFDKIGLCFSLMVVFGSIYGLLAFGLDAYKEQEWYISLLPIVYLMIRILWKIFSKLFLGKINHTQKLDRKLKNLNLEEEIEFKYQTKDSYFESKLNEINELRNKGLISNEEYKIMRNKVLGL